MEKPPKEFSSPDIPVENAIVIGSFCLLAYADKYGLMLTDGITAHDIDLTVDPKTYAMLQQSDWHPNSYRGVTTLRDKPDGNHLYDAGTSAYIWPYEELLRKGFTIEHQGVTYLDPLRLLAWKIALARKKDQPHVKFLSEQAVPAWAKSFL